MELPALHPWRRSRGDAAAQCEPPGPRRLSGRGEDRGGDSHAVEKPEILHVALAFPTHTLDIPCVHSSHVIS